MRIVDDANFTSPPAGSIVALGQLQTVRIRLTVDRDDATAVTAKGWVALPDTHCVPFSPTETCSTLVTPIVEAPAGSDAGDHRTTFTFIVDVRTTGECTTFDAFVSSEFVAQSGADAHRPIQRNDVVHARWYLIKPTQAQPLGGALSCPTEMGRVN
jgi:hypothetical protein